MDKFESKCDWWFSSGWISWIFNRSKWRLLLLLNKLLCLWLSILLLWFGFRFLLFFLIIGCPWRVLAHRIILISLPSLLRFLGLVRDSSNFTRVSPSIIWTCSIIMSETEITGTAWFVVNFYWGLTLVMLWEIHLNFIFIIINCLFNYL